MSDSDFLMRSDLQLQVDPPRPYVWRASGAFVGDKKVKDGTPIQWVHVISPFVGGEIRGYVLVDGHLHLRGPCYGGTWDELDNAVAKRLAARLVPYEFTNNSSMPVEKQPRAGAGSVTARYVRIAVRHIAARLNGNRDPNLPGDRFEAELRELVGDDWVPRGRSRAFTRDEVKARAEKLAQRRGFEVDPKRIGWHEYKHRNPEDFP